MERRHEPAPFHSITSSARSLILKRRKRVVRLAVDIGFVPFAIRFWENLAFCRDVRFSNRPVWVKRFQTIHQCWVDVACRINIGA